MILQSRVSFEILWKIKFSFSTCPRPNKARYVHNRLNMWSHEITWQIKNIPPSSQCLWSPNLSLTQKFAWTLSGLVRSLYLHLQKTHGHQTRQGTGLPWETPNLRAAWPFDHMTKWQFGKLILPLLQDLRLAG